MSFTSFSRKAAPAIHAGSANATEMVVMSPEDEAPHENALDTTVTASTTISEDPEQQPSAPTSDDPFGNEANAEVHYKTCKWYHAGVLMIAETISLGVLALPQALASLGFVPGFLLILFLGAISGYTGHLIGLFKLRYPQVQSFADCGEMIAGPIGQEVMAAASLLVLIFIAGAHVLSFAIALNVMTGHATCTVVFSVVGMLVSFFFTLSRTLKNVSYFSITACASITVASTVAMTAIAIQKPDIGNILTVRPGIPVVKGLGPVMNIILAYSGHVTFFSIYSELEDPRNYKKALAMTQIFTISFYLLLASVIYYFAGPLVASPALGSASPVVRKVAFGNALPTIVISGVINGHVACKYLYLRICSTATVHSKSTKALLSWTAIVAATWIVSFIIAEAIPNFNVLLGLIAALFSSWFSYGLPPVLWLYMSKGEWWNGKKRTVLTILNMLLSLLGAIICALGMWNSGYELSRIKAGEVFSCKSNWQPSVDMN